MEELFVKCLGISNMDLHIYVGITIEMVLKHFESELFEAIYSISLTVNTQTQILVFKVK